MCAPIAASTPHHQNTSSLPASISPSSSNPAFDPRRPIPIYLPPEKSIKCPQCQATFGTEKGLKYHMVKHGSGAFQYRCPFCDKGLNSTYQFKCHLKQHGGTGQHYFCHLCGTTIEVVQQFLSHVQQCKSRHNVVDLEREGDGDGVYSESEKEELRKLWDWSTVTQNFGGTLCQKVIIHQVTRARVIIEVSGHQYQWLASGYDLEIGYFRGS